MIIYDKERKTLVVPEGIGCECSGGDCAEEYRQGYQRGYSSGYTDGLSDCSGYTPTDCSSAITEAYQSGVTEGMAEQKALLSSTAITSNGTYTNENGWNSVNVNVPHFMPAEEKTLSLVEHSTGPWEVVASYPIGMSKVTVEDNGYGQGKYDEGYADGLADCSGSTDCSSAITEAYQSGYTEGYNQGQADCPECSGGTCNLVTGSAPLGSSFDGDDTVTPPQGYDGFSSLRIVDNGYGQSKYDSGYTEGYNDGLAQCSGGTCPTETGLINLDSGWSGYESYHPLGSGYYDEVIITDNGYGQAKFDQGYELGLATCSASSGSCLIEDEQTVSLNNDWTGFTIVYPSQGYDGLGRVLVADLGYGQAKYDEGYADGHTSGYTEGYNAAITANCGSAITEAYESGVTEGQGSIFSVKVRWLSPVTSWSLDNNYYPDLFIVDESGTSHQLNYVYQQSPTLVRYNTGMEDDTPQGWIMFAEFAGYLQDGAKYIQPYQVKFPMLNNNLWNNNIEGLSVEINGEVIHNWRQDNSGLDDWQFGSGAWRFTPLATVVSDTYYDATHKMVTFYIQGQVPNNN